MPDETTTPEADVPTESSSSAAEDTGRSEPPPVANDDEQSPPAGGDAPSPVESADSADDEAVQVEVDASDRETTSGADADAQALQGLLARLGVTEDQLLAAIARLEPSRTFGQLIVHFAARDVTTMLDGATAMRVLQMFQRRREGALGDEIRRSSAGNLWFVFDIDEPLAISWIPGLPGQHPRTAVDPAPPGLAA
jgi:hypothetical protein